MQDTNTISATANASDADFSYKFNIEIKINDLIDLILNSTSIPLTEYLIVDRVELLHQLSQIKANLPVDLATAIEIASCRQQIIAEAENYASLVVKSAEEQASKMLQDSSILRQAELDGAKIRLRVERECEELKQSAIAECLAIQTDADNYADCVLDDIEQRLEQILIVIKNGREQIAESTLQED